MITRQDKKQARRDLIAGVNRSDDCVSVLDWMHGWEQRV